MAEQLRLEQVLGDRAAVDRDERLIPPRARHVYGFCEQLLARAGLARQQHSRIGFGNHARLLQARFHQRAARDDVGIPILDSLREPRDLHRALHVVEQLILVDWLGQKPECAALCRFDRIGDRTVRREQQDA